VRPAPEAGTSFDAATMATVAGVPHVQAAWGEIDLAGGFSATSTPATLRTDSLIALAPRARWTQRRPCSRAGCPAPTT